MPNANPEPPTTMPALHHSHPEPEERNAAPKTPVVYNDKYSAEHIAAVEALDRRRLALGLSDGQWIKGAKFDQGTWSKLRGGKYGAKPDNVIAEFERHADALENLAANPTLRRPDQSFKFIPWSGYELAARALQQAKVNAEAHVADRCGENRNVVYVVLQHGWGKDEMAGQLQRTYGGNRIFARHGWSKSDYAAMCSIAKQLGISPPNKRDNFRSAAEAEETILEHLKEHPRPLYFLEVELTGEALQNLWKELSNETRCVITIFCLPEFFERHKRRLGVYSEQLRARAEFIVQADTVDSAWVQAAMKEKLGQVPDAKLLAQHLARSATQIGGLRCVTHVLESLKADPATREGLTLAAVQDHVALWRESRHLHPGARAAA